MPPLTSRNKLSEVRLLGDWDPFLAGFGAALFWDSLKIAL